jgi:predicted nucleic-acid-binding Zn-ribbon protein
VKGTKQDLEREFVCPKCRHHGALVQEVQLGRGVARMLPLHADRYWAAACGLCGYTELYRLAIVEKATEDAAMPAEPKLADKTE